MGGGGLAQLTGEALVCACVIIGNIFVDFLKLLRNGLSSTVYCVVQFPENCIG